VERYDIAVIGLGGIGSATAWFAARSGQSVIGLERFELGGHHHGASHDHSRIIRHSYHTPHYVDLTRLAYDAWRGHLISRLDADGNLVTDFRSHLRAD